MPKQWHSLRVTKKTWELWKALAQIMDLTICELLDWSGRRLALELAEKDD